MAAPRHHTLDPDALPWPGPPCKADLGVHVLPLTHGGELIVTEHDGEYQAHLHRDGVSVQVRLSPSDVNGLRSLTGDLIVGRVRA